MGPWPASAGRQQGSFSVAAGSSSVCRGGGGRHGRAVQRGAEGGDMGGGGAAAAAEDHDAAGQHVGHQRDELLRRAVVHRPAVHNGGHTRVGLGDQGDAGVLPQAPELGQHLLRPGGAVQAEGIDAHALQHGEGGGDVGTGDAAAVPVAGERDENGLVGDGADGQHGGPCIGQGHHRLNDIEIDAGLLQTGHLLGVGIHQIVEGRAAQRGEEQTGGSQIARQQRPPAGRLPGKGGQTAVIIGSLTGDAVLRQLHGVAAEGGGVQHLTAGGHIVPLNGADGLRVGQCPLLGADIAGVAALLQLGAGGAVQNKGETKLHSHTSVVK